MKEKNNKSYFQNLKNKFDLITSKNGRDWLLALNWIFIFEFISSIIEYKLIEKAQNYIHPLTEGLFKEIFIAVLIVFLVWYAVYNIIFLKRRDFLLFSLYLLICFYLLFTNDMTFNLLLHNLNPFEIFIDDFGFYMLIQIILKLTILYLVYKIILIFKNSK